MASATGSTVVHPADVGEAAALLRAASADGASVQFRGSDTKVGWAGSPDPVELTVRTDAANSLIAHHPGDMTAVVQAGMRLDDLQQALASSGQWLAIDPATQSDGATIGGLLAAGDAGPRRLRYGSMRDLAIGATLVLVDGTVVHTGSHVIKNVAGYDLTKLFYASFGTLGLIAEVVVRLHPVPPASATVVATVAAAGAVEASSALATCGVPLSAVEWMAPERADRGNLLVRLDSHARGVEAGVRRVRETLDQSGTSAELLPAADAAQQWVEHAASTRAGSGGSVLAAFLLPTRVGVAVDHVHRLADGHQVSVRVTVGLAIGMLTVVVSGETQAQLGFLEAVRASLIAQGASVAVRDRPVEVDQALDAMGPPPPELALLRAIQRQLDPQRRCAPGRFGSWY